MAQALPAGGVYVAVFHLRRARTLSVGGRGRRRFEAGLYAYVGSAQRHLGHRLARHARRDKVRRWHIDYLSVHAPLVGALVYAGPKTLECAIAAVLARDYPQPVAGFGCSDCRCRSHLFLLAGLPAQGRRD